MQAHAGTNCSTDELALLRPSNLTLKQEASEKVVQPTIVGELHNAWSDSEGTSATFTYARGKRASTTFGWSWDVPFDDIAGLSTGTEKNRVFEQRGSVSEPAFNRRLSRFVKSEFQYQQFRVRYHRCLPPASVVRPVGWLGSSNTDTKVKGALDQCNAAVLGGGFRPGQRLTTDDAKAQTYAVTVGGALLGLGAKLTVQSGFDESTNISYLFGKRKRHYLCGPDGEQPPLEAPRIFAGVRS